MNKVEEARVAVETIIRCSECGGGGTLGPAPGGKLWSCEECGGDEDAPGTGMDGYVSFGDVMNAVDAYGAARELKGHVGACNKWRYPATADHALYCGDGWLCDKAKEIEELGR